MANGKNNKQSFSANKQGFSANKHSFSSNKHSFSSNKKKLPSNKITNFLKGAGVYLLIGLAAFIFFINTSGGGKLENEVPISSVVQNVKDNKIEKLTLEGDKVIVVFKEKDKKGVAHKETGESIYKILESSGVDPKSVTIEVKDTSWQQAIIALLGNLLPIILMVGLLFFLFRQAREAGQSIFSFGQSKAKMYSKDQPQIKFTDVAGVEEAKKELEEVVDFLKNPQKYKEIGARTPKGVLLVGPPGVGKTLLARAVAGQAGVPFLSIAGSEFMEILVGVGASRVRDLFLQAKKSAPSIIFIDEIESIGRMRGLGFSGGHDEREQTLNQILSEMDGFTPNDNLVILAASVTSDTPILIKDKNGTKLLPIGAFVDQYYPSGEEGVEKSVDDIETLGFERKITTPNDKRLLFQNSAFKKVRSVFRHKVREIYKISYLGGKIKTTGNHSVFVRTNQGIVPKRVSELKPKDILVNIPRSDRDNPIKRPIVQKVEKLSFNGYVYDLCGVENEAFFGGESPILLHNTNRPDMLDPALIRPGRFDRRVVLSLPDLEERKAIIQLHMKGKPFTEDVDTEKLARRTVGFSGADLANMLNEAAIMAAREGKSVIDPHHLEEAATKEKLGPRRQRMQTEEDRKLAAFHEAGHAVVGHFSKHIDPIHRISIVSRGISGGHTIFPPSRDRANETKSRLLDQIVTALGGQAAEKMIFNDTSTGAASDLEVATHIAKAMVMEYGMSDLGPIASHPRAVFGLWMRMSDDGGGISPQLQNQIDKEVRKILDQSYKKAQTILTKNKAKLEKVAKALLDKETLESAEFERIVGKNPNSINKTL